MPGEAKTETVPDAPALEPEAPPPIAAAAPSSDAHAPNAAEFLAGQALGRIEHKVDQALEQNARILGQHHDFEEVVGRLATEVVDVRARVSRLESSPPPPAPLPPPPALPPMRAPAPSVNTEIRTEIARIHDSIQAGAMKSEEIDKKQDTQSQALTALATTIKPISLFFTPKVVIGLFAMGVVLAGVVSGLVQRIQAPPVTPVVVTTPALPAAPAAPAPRAPQ